MMIHFSYTFLSAAGKTVRSSQVIGSITYILGFIVQLICGRLFCKIKVFFQNSVFKNKGSFTASTQYLSPLIGFSLGQNSINCLNRPVL